MGNSLSATPSTNLTTTIPSPKIIQMGSMRKLTEEEKTITNKTVDYVWVVVKPYICKWGNYLIVVPSDFLSDGATDAPDVGVSWLFHDYLYATHKFTECINGDGDLSCTRSQADNLMSALLYQEQRKLYYLCFTLAAYINPLNGFGKPWVESHLRGPEFLPTNCPVNPVLLFTSSS